MCSPADVQLIFAELSLTAELKLNRDEAGDAVREERDGKGGVSEGHSLWGGGGEGVVMSRPA